MLPVDTVLPADSAEFCPAPACQRFLVCGTYQLEEALPSSNYNWDDNATPSSCRARRLGECLLYEVNEGSDECTQIQTITMPAVLDMKWSSNLLAIADAEGHVTLQLLREENGNLERVQTLTCSPKDPNAICLSLDWAKYRLETQSDTMSVSLSNGTALIAKKTAAGLTVTDSWKAHAFEPWITAWDRWDLNAVYTGGDDCKFKVWDVRAGFAQPALVNNCFDSGVTSMQSSLHIQHMLAVGSYDSTVRLFDMRQPLKSVTETNVGGGAWRVKWHPDASRRHHLLVACMHDGFKVVDFGRPIPVDTQTEGWRVLIRYDQHKSLAYGADWSYTSADKDGTLVATCSFYDHSLSLWRA